MKTPLFYLAFFVTILFQSCNHVGVLQNNTLRLNSPTNSPTSNSNYESSVNSPTHCPIDSYRATQSVPFSNVISSLKGFTEPPQSGNGGGLASLEVMTIDNLICLLQTVGDSTIIQIT